MEEALFSGIRVLDCASFVAAPAAATLMSDFGADVIKIEPLSGETYRWAYRGVQPTPEHNFLWMIGSRNKRSLAIDLKSPKGFATFERLIDTADVFITNMPLSARKRLKIGYDDLASTRPRLIYASFSAYGESGPDSEKGGYDITAYSARTGIMHFARAGAQADPLTPGAGLGDQSVGVALYAAIVSALFRRERTGKGGQVGASLLSAGLWANGLPIQGKLCNVPDTQFKPRTQVDRALVNSYRCRDGRWLFLMILDEPRVPRLLEAIGRADLGHDPRFSTPDARLQNNQALIAELDREFAKRDLKDWTAALTAAGVTFDPVATLDDLADDAQIQAIQGLTPFVDKPDILTINTPFEVRGVKKSGPRLPPELGQHTAEVLREVGFSAEEIERLAEEGVVRLGPGDAA
ncbi:MAG: CaiB/BaiF CoA transferase family protein [Hyphomonadaceae bacterium]